jgi:hypothetical protein
MGERGPLPSSGPQHRQSRCSGAQVAYTLGTPAVQELLEALERSEKDRAALMGRLYVRDEARWLAELLIEIEEDPDDLARLSLIAALRRGLGR